MRRTVFPANGAGTTDVHMQNNEVGLLHLLLHLKVKKKKRIIGKNVRIQTGKLLGKNVGVNLHNQWILRCHTKSTSDRGTRT